MDLRMPNRKIGIFYWKKNNRKEKKIFKEKTFNQKGF